MMPVPYRDALLQDFSPMQPSCTTQGNTGTTTCASYNVCDIVLDGHYPLPGIGLCEEVTLFASIPLLCCSQKRIHQNGELMFHLRNPFWHYNLEWECFIHANVCRIVYNEVVQTSKLLMRDVTVVSLLLLPVL